MAEIKPQCWIKGRFNSSSLKGRLKSPATATTTGPLCVIGEGIGGGEVVEVTKVSKARANCSTYIAAQQREREGVRLRHWECDDCI